MILEGQVSEADLVSVRGGGHNAPGNAVCQGGLMIDLANMRGVRVDPVRRTARAEGGATWGDFDRETQAFGLATTGGSVSDTGIAGLTLGGGLGWLAGKHGLSCDNLRSVDVVIADGTMIANAEENADLFWGLRGGGGNFGVVTSFEFQLHPVGTVVAGMVLYPFGKAREALTLYREFATSIPDEVNTIGGLLTSSDGNPVVAIVVCCHDSLEAAEERLRAIRSFGPPVADDIGPMPYPQVQTLLDAVAVRGRRNYIKSNMMQSISDGAIDTLVERFATIPSPYSFVFFQQAIWGAGDGSVTIRRIGDYSVDYALVKPAKVGGKTKVMADAFIAPSGSDVTPAFQTYLRPLLGSDLPQPARLRGGIVAKVLER